MTQAAFISLLGCGSMSLFVPAAHAQATAGAIISEFRFRGASGAADEYVELVNTTTGVLNIGGWSLQINTGTAQNPDFRRVTLPANILIPARGHFLFTGSAYSLSAYGTGNALLPGDASDDSGAALFNAAGAV